MNLHAVQNKKHLHRGMSNTFIAINEAMVSNQRISERSNLVYEGRVGIFASHGHSRLSYRG